MRGDGGVRSTPSTGAAACPPPPVVKAPRSGAGLRPAINAAARYLAVRENRLSACASSPVSWENDVEHLMTGKGWQAHPRVDYDKGALQKKAKRNGWCVRATVTCGPNPEMGAPTATVKPRSARSRTRPSTPLGVPCPPGSRPAPGWRSSRPRGGREITSP